MTALPAAWFDEKSKLTLCNVGEYDGFPSALRMTPIISIHMLIPIAPRIIGLRGPQVPR